MYMYNRVCWSVSQDNMLHIALFVKYEHEPFFINGSFINS